MRDVDLDFWDTAVRKGSDGYSYGVVWGDDSKFLKNLQFKELRPGGGAGAAASLNNAPPIDPATMAIAATVHQIQQTLERLEDKIDRVLGAVEWLETRRQSKQAAELLTAVATLNSVGRKCFKTGTLEPEDLLRIAHLEQVVGTVHREICMELADLAKEFAFTDVRSAKKAHDIGSGRVADLVALDLYALNGLRTWHQLMLLSKANRGSVADEEIEGVRGELRQLTATVRAAISQIVAVDTKMDNRSIWAYMGDKGIPKGLADDNALRIAANKTRKKAQKKANAATASVRAFSGSLKQLDVIIPAGSQPLRLLPAGAAEQRPPADHGHPGTT